jgi:uncharacterized ubiquitin-like protein YukD
MKLTITLGTRFVPTPDKARYEEHSRFELDIPTTTTIGELIELIDRQSPPMHPGSSYLSLPNPHGTLSEAATLADLGLTEGAILRLFSKVR